MALEGNGGEFVDGVGNKTADKRIDIRGKLDDTISHPPTRKGQLGYRRWPGSKSILDRVVVVLEALYGGSCWIERRKGAYRCRWWARQGERRWSSPDGLEELLKCLTTGVVRLCVHHGWDNIVWLVD